MLKRLAIHHQCPWYAHAQDKTGCWHSSRMTLTKKTEREIHYKAKTSYLPKTSCFNWQEAVRLRADTGQWCSALRLSKASRAQVDHGDPLSTSADDAFGKRVTSDWRPVVHFVMSVCPFNTLRSMIISSVAEKMNWVWLTGETVKFRIRL